MLATIRVWAPKQPAQSMGLQMSACLFIVKSAMMRVLRYTMPSKWHCMISKPRVEGRKG